MQLPARLWEEHDLEAIERMAFAILDKVGLAVESPAAHDAMLAFGCKLSDDGRIRIPASAVTSALSACPRSFRLTARDPRHSLDMDAAPAQIYTHNMSGAATLCDAMTGERRPATCRDQARLTRVMHHLRNLHSVCPMVQLQDVPASLEPLYSYLIAAWETDKFVSAPGIEEQTQAGYLSEMARVVVDARPSADAVIDFYSCLLSPLRLPAADADKLLGMVGMDRAAMMIISSPTAGTTAPVTLPAAIAQQHAELLAGVVALQAVAPGTPTTLGPRLGAADLRSGLLASGRYSTGLASAAAVELARRSGLACDCYGLCTDSIVPDAQSGYERAINGLLGLAPRPRALSGIGDMQTGMTTCLEALLIDDDIIGQLLAWAGCSGDSLDDDALDVSVVVQGVASPQGFLGLDHTRRHRSDGSAETRVAYEGGLTQWMREGWRDIVERATAVVPDILAIGPVGLPDEVLEGLCDLVRQAARDMEVSDYPDPRGVVLES